MKKATPIPMIVIIILILFWVILLWCIKPVPVHQVHDQDSEEIPQCMTFEEGTVRNIVKKVKKADHCVSLMNVTVKLTWNDEDAKDYHTVWFWGLERRGSFILTILSDWSFLSVGILQHEIILPISITMNGTSHSNNDSCVVKSLFNIFKHVRSSVETPYEDYIMNDVICKGERYFSNVSCWNIPDIVNDSGPHAIHSPISKVAFSIALGLTLAFIYLLWRSYTGVYNHHQPDQDDEEEYVNILQIKLIPLTSQYWHVVYASLVFLFHLLVFSCYESKMLGYLSSQRKFRIYNFCSDILYILGIIILLVHSYRIANKCQVTKRTSILCYTVVFILCFFRFITTTGLLVAFISLTVCGIISEGSHAAFPSSSSINTISYVVFSIFIFIKFFDNYQKLYYKIYSIGKDLDEKTFPHKIFEQTSAETSQTWRKQSKIKSSLLSKIVERSLPFYTHLFKTIAHFIVGLFFIACVALIVIIIDDGFSSPMGYIFTVAPLVIGTVGNSSGYSFAAGGKAMNRSQDEHLQLENDLRYYAEKGEFPDEPEPPSWQSFLKRLCPCFSREGRERVQDEEYEMLEVSNSPDYTSVTLVTTGATGAVTPKKYAKKEKRKRREKGERT